jgi:hypothetical protein
MYKLKDWINIDKLDLSLLALNKYAIDIIEKNYDKLDKKCFENLALNPNAIHLLHKYLKYNLKETSNLFWINLSQNDGAYTLIRKYLLFTKNYYLSKNNSITKLLLKNPHKINIQSFHYNDSKLAIEYIKNNIHLFNISLLCLNKNAISIIEKIIEEKDLNKEKYKLFEEINWNYLSLNPYAIKILEKYPQYINWFHLSRNKNAIHILKNNISKISFDNLIYNENAYEIIKENINYYNFPYYHYEMLYYNKNSKIIDLIKPQFFCDDKYFKYLSKNKNIFELDYYGLKKRMDIIREELIKKVYHPNNIKKWLDNNFYDF